MSDWKAKRDKEASIYFEGEACFSPDGAQGFKDGWGAGRKDTLYELEAINTEQGMKLATAIEALEFYANKAFILEKIWENLGEYEAWQNDKGLKASKALVKIRGEP